LAIVGSVYCGALFGTDFFGQPEYRDEFHYWDTALYFVENFPPGLEDVRFYSEKCTSLSFMIWAAVEKTFGAGVAGGRFTVFFFISKFWCSGCGAGRTIGVACTRHAG
jgi:hypothetical protein